MLINSSKTKFVLGVLTLCLFTFTACKKDKPLSNLAGFIEFSIKDKAFTFSIDETTRTIQNADSLPYLTDVSALTAIFSAVPYSVVKVGANVQVSGTTVNSFASPVTYTVTAQDGATTRSYTVRVNVALVDPNTVAWNQLTPDAAWGTYHNTYVSYLSGKFYMMGATLGFSNSLTMGSYSSTDGITWTRLKSADNLNDSIPHGEYGAFLPFNNKLWILGGHLPGVGFSFDFVTNKVWSSSDGATWAASASAVTGDRWSIRERIPALAYNSKLWVIGGNAYPYGGNTNATGTNLKDVWSSADGTTWAQVNATPAFDARSMPAVVVHDNKMYLIGGKSGATYYNDIWTSTDGNTWTQLTVSTPFTGRWGHQVIDYNGTLYMVGGEDATGVLNDLWVSTDHGVNWSKVAAGNVRALPANFTNRKFFSMFVQNNTMYIAGGQGTDGVTTTLISRRDVWKGKLVK